MLSEKSRAQIAKNRRERCKHFTGTSSPTCKAGVNYEELAGGHHGMMCRLPCWEPNTFAKPEDVIVPCEKREFYTEAEIAEILEATERSLENSIKARQAITDHLKANNKPLRNVAGNIPCPACGKGTLRFSIASNGRCHAACSTAHCVSWIE